MVAIKRVVDYNVRVLVRSDETGVDTSNVKMAMNPFCEIALEAAVQLFEAGIVTHIVVVSIGHHCQDILRQALAMGAHEAIQIEADDVPPLGVAKLLQKLVKEHQVDLVLLGKQSIDGDNNQTPQMLAGLLGWPQATYASRIVINDRHVEVTREVDGGLLTVRTALPCVISADLRLNKPRFIALPNIIKAKQKPLTVMPLEAFAIDIEPQNTVVRVTGPKPRQPGVMVTSVEALVDKLKNEAKVL